MQSSLFLDSPKTEGVKYVGSKLRLLSYILQLIRKVNPNNIFDGFTGTNRISQAFAKTGYKVMASDIAVWSKVFGLCYLKNKQSKIYYQELIDHLNTLKKYGYLIN